MLVLKIGRAPEWVDLVAGVRVRVLPLTSAVMMAVRSDLAAEGLADTSVDGWHAALVKAIARRIVEDWKGVGDEAGNPLTISPEGIDALLDLHRVFAAFDAAVIAPYLMVQSEKNGSAPSPNGTSAAAETTAAPAKASAKSARAN